MYMIEGVGDGESAVKPWTHKALYPRQLLRAWKGAFPNIQEELSWVQCFVCPSHAIDGFIKNALRDTSTIRIQTNAMSHVEFDTTAWGETVFKSTRPSTRPKQAKGWRRRFYFRKSLRGTVLSVKDEFQCPKSGYSIDMRVHDMRVN